MASKTFTAYHKDTDNKYGIQVVCTSVADAAANTSKLTAKFSIIHPTINISSRTGKLVIDGKTYSFTAEGIHKSGPTLLYTKTVTIEHNNDGTRSVKIAASFPFDMTSNSYGRLGTVSGSGSMTLDDIPRTSSIAASTASVEVNGTNEWRLTMTKHADAFRHKATLTFADQKIVTDVFDTEVGVVIPVGWLSKLPTQMQAVVDVSVQTYSDESCTTAIGPPVTTAFEIKVPADAAPVLSEGWARLSVLNTGTAADGMNTYVQGFSRAQAVFDSSLVELKYGATGATYSVVCDGVADSSMTPVFTSGGIKTVTCIATDSRGLQSSQTFEIEVQPYFLPTLSGISLYRCDISGAEDEEGTMLFFKASCRFAECGGENRINMIAEWKNVSGAYWGNATALANGEGSVLGSGAISTTSSYNARITATDRLGNQASYTALISTANVSFHIRDGGKGGAFGKYGERDGLLDCLWDLLVRGDAEIEGKIDVDAVRTRSLNASEDITAGKIAASTDIAAKAMRISDGTAIGLDVNASGAAIGMASTATGDRKKFEVASDHEAFFNGGVHGVTNYSEAEVATGGTWIDGRPIYRKIFTNSVTILSGGATWVPTGINSIDTIIHLESYVKYSSSIGALDTPSNPSGVSQDGSAVDLFDKTNSSLRVRRGSGYGSIAVGDAYFIMEYTKEG